jgi:hypothetical protein
LHDVAVAAVEFQKTRDPAADLGVADDVLVGIMQDPPIAHECAATCDGHDLTEGRYPILQRHQLR